MEVWKLGLQNIKMSSVEQEVKTLPIENYFDNYFRKQLIDGRYQQVVLREFGPSSGMTPFYSEAPMPIVFKLEQLSGTEVYLLHDMMMSVHVKILKANKLDLPSTGSTVSVANNFLHSLFKTFELKINGTRITYTDHYPYKAYVDTLLTYGRNDNKTWLAAQGWSMDTTGEFDDMTRNTAYKQRQKRFLKNMALSEGFSTEGAVFTGRVYHDLVGCEKPLPPKSWVELMFKRAPDQFLLVKPANDTEQYVVGILKFVIYVPVATMTNDCFSSFLRRHQHEAALFHFRRFAVEQQGVLKTTEYVSDPIYSNEKVFPTRIFVIFIDAKRVHGSYDSNPFNFLRQWTVTVTNTDDIYLNELRRRDTDDATTNLQFQMMQANNERMLQILEQVQKVQSQFQKEKQKRKKLKELLKTKETAKEAEKLSSQDKKKTSGKKTPGIAVKGKKLTEASDPDPDYEPDSEEGLSSSSEEECGEEASDYDELGSATVTEEDDFRSAQDEVTLQQAVPSTSKATQSFSSKGKPSHKNKKLKVDTSNRQNGLRNSSHGSHDFSPQSSFWQQRVEQGVGTTKTISIESIQLMITHQPIG